MTPSLWAYSSTSWALGMTLSEASAKSSRQIKASRGGDVDRRRTLADLDELPGPEIANGLTIGDEHRGLVIDQEANHLVDGDHDGASNGEVGRHRSKDHDGERRVDDR